MKSLNTIKIVYSVVNIISLIIMIFCIIGAVFCGITAVALAGLFIIDSASGVLTEILGKLDFGTFGVAISSLIAETICASISAVMFSKLKKYCKSIQNFESPFNEEFAKQTLEMGKIWIILCIVMAVITGVFSIIRDTVIDDFGFFDITLGLFLLFLSAVYRYGSAINKNNSNDGNATPIKNNEEGSPDLFDENVNDEPKDKIFL